MRDRLSDMRTLGDLLTARGLTMDAAAVLGQVDTATISRICSGQVRATPKTVVSLAMALGVNARRMARLCDQPWRDAHVPHNDERTELLRGIDIDARAGER